MLRGLRRLPEKPTDRLLECSAKSQLVFQPGIGASWRRTRSGGGAVSGASTVAVSQAVSGAQTIGCSDARPARSLNCVRGRGLNRFKGHSPSSSAGPPGLTGHGLPAPQRQPLLTRSRRQRGRGERGERGLKLGVGEVGEGARLGQQLLVEDAAEGEHRQPAVLDLLELPHVDWSVFVFEKKLM